jgi:hypothetical protein
VPLLHDYFYLVVSKAFFRAGMLFGVPAPGLFVLALYKLTLPHGYFLTWFFHGFFFRSSLTGIFNVVFSPLFFYVVYSTPAFLYMSVSCVWLDF